MKSALGKSRINKPVAQLSMTSLMDVLTILLLFLLVNYSESQQQIEMTKGVRLPALNGERFKKVEGDIGVSVEGSRIVIGERQYGAQNYLRDKERLVSELAQAIQAVRADKYAKKSDLSVSIRADKNTPFEVVDVIISAAATQNITKIELVALSSGR